MESAKGLSISPIQAEINISPGDKLTKGFTLKNTLDHTVDVNLSTAEYILLDDEYQLVEDSSDIIADNIISLSSSSLKLKAGESRDIVVTIAAGEGVNDGSYYPVILASFGSNSEQQTSIDPSLGFNLKINVSEQFPARTVEVKSLKVANPVLGQNFSIAGEIANPTEYYTKPIGYIQVIGPQEKVIWREVINDSLQHLLPNESISKIYGVSINNGDELLMPGQYRTELLVLDRQFGTYDSTQAEFYLIPYWVLGVILGVFILGIALYKSRSQLQKVFGKMMRRK